MENRLYCNNHLLFMIKLIKQKGSRIMKKLGGICLLLILFVYDTPNDERTFRFSSLADRRTKNYSSMDAWTSELQKKKDLHLEK